MVAGQPDRDLSDEQALERYRYMLRTAPPETIERAHEEAFAKLTPDQRRMLLEQLRSATPPYERDAAGQSKDDPRTLARMATRAELREPGSLERVFGGTGRGMGGMGMGGLLAGGFLSSLAGAVVGSMIAQQFFGHTLGAPHGVAEAADADARDFESESGDDAAGFDTDSDVAGDVGGDLGGDFGADV